MEIMNINQRLDLIKQVGEEIVTEDELKTLLETKKHLVAYDGFEPSGEMHIAQAILRTINVNKMIKAGVKFKMLIADWFGWMNNKLGGDLDKIRTTGKYFIEMWKACGMDVKGVEFIWSKDLVRQEGHWKNTIDIARNSTVQRIIRTSQIMGRKSTETLSAAQIIYPCMQAADIFHLRCDICQLGMDQRKVNILAREVGPRLGFWKPVIVSHHMLLGLSELKTDYKDPIDRLLDLKMSKSNPDSAIFMSDTEGEVNRKIKKAYCPQGVVKDNPVLEYCKYIIFEKFKTIKVERPKKFGGNLEFNSYESLEMEFLQKKLHPMDLKQSVAEYLNKLIYPVRKKLEKNRTAQKLAEEIKTFKVTR